MLIIREQTQEIHDFQERLRKMLKRLLNGILRVVGNLSLGLF